MDELIIDVMDCPRCGQRHPGVRFAPFVNPPRSVPLMTHWAWCPETWEPVLLQKLGTARVNKALPYGVRRRGKGAG